MFRDSQLDRFNDVDSPTTHAATTHEAETAEWPCHQPCPYDEEGGYHTCLLDANHAGRHFCAHKHAW